MGRLASWLRFGTLMLTNVWVDGFNLYYGCLKGTPYKWLDLGALCQALLPPNKILRIRLLHGQGQRSSGSASAGAPEYLPPSAPDGPRADRAPGSFLEFDRAHASRQAGSRRTSNR